MAAAVRVVALQCDRCAATVGAGRGPARVSEGERAHLRLVAVCGWHAMYTNGAEAGSKVSVQLSVARRPSVHTSATGGRYSESITGEQTNNYLLRRFAE